MGRWEPSCFKKPFKEGRKKILVNMSAPWVDHEDFLSVSCGLAVAVPVLEAKIAVSTTGVALNPYILEALSFLSGGIQSVAIWRARTPQRLPHAIETTCKLSEAVMNDVNGSVSIDALCAMYSMALMRGVNGLTDTANQRGVVASSVASIASSLGLPGWLVDLRHDISHNDLPELGCLRLGAAQLLGFVLENYWDKKKAAVFKRLQSAHSLLLRYKTVSKKTLGGGKETQAALAGEYILRPAR
jgi:ribosomal biogenesis protein LAS1